MCSMVLRGRWVIGAAVIDLIREALEGLRRWCFAGDVVATRNDEEEHESHGRHGCADDGRGEGGAGTGHVVGGFRC